MTVKNEKPLPLFAEIRQLLAPYQEVFVARRDEPGYFDLWSKKDVVIDGRLRQEVCFAGLIVQKSYVDGDLRAMFGRSGWRR